MKRDNIWLIITPFESYELELIDCSEHRKEELALCIENQFGVKEIK